MSDSAPEFVGKIVSGLMKALNVRHITTRGYNARGNSICERVHEFLGQCLTRMAPESRDMWPDHVHEFAFAHNTAVHSSIGCSPFEVGHGVEARTFTSAMALRSPNDEFVPSDAEVAGYYGRIKQSAAELRELAATTMTMAASDSNARLNRRGNATEYAVGDRVSIYFPANGVNSEWKQKHMLQWRGPLVITERISPTTYAMRDPRSPATVKDYVRTVTNINPYRADAVQTIGDDVVATFGLSVGDFVATLDDADTKVVSIGKVEHLDADELTVHYWATRGSKVSTAVFKPAYIGVNTGKTIMAHTLRSREEPCEMWTGRVPLELVLGLVVFAVDKHGAHRLHKESRGLLHGHVLARV
jgi:hypothetical protein